MPYDVYVVSTTNKGVYQVDNDILTINEVSVDTQGDSNDRTTGSDELDRSQKLDEIGEPDTVSNDTSIIESNIPTNDSPQVENESRHDSNDETPVSVIISIPALLLTAFRET